MFTKTYPHKKIEILNFGLSGDSFQEQFFFWSAYRKKYQLDYILLGPRGFSSDRDSTFCWNFNILDFIRYPKHRFILTKNGSSIREIPIKLERERERES